MSPRGDLPTLLIHGGPDAEGGEDPGGSTDSPTSSVFSDPSVCTACREEGTLILCEGEDCKQELHFDCADPPLTAAEVEHIDRWYCKKCEYRGEPERQAYEEAQKRVASNASASRGSGKRGSLAGPGAIPEMPARTQPPGKSASLVEKLLHGVSELDSKQFTLPKEIRDFFSGVSTTDKGSYTYKPPFKQVDKRSRGLNYLMNDMNLPVEKRIFDAKGFLIVCYQCGLGKREGHNYMLSCDYCRFNWHIDCLPYPMPTAPSAKDGKLKKWKCPLHADDDQLPALKRVRTAKYSRFEELDISQLDGGDFWIKDCGEAPNGENYQVPSEGIRLRWDYLEVQKRFLKQKEHRRQIAKRVHERRPGRASPPLSSRSTTPRTPNGFDIDAVHGNGNGYSTTTIMNGNGIGDRTPSSSVAGSHGFDRAAAAEEFERYRREDIEGVIALAELGQAFLGSDRRSSSSIPLGSSPPTSPMDENDLPVSSSGVDNFVKDATELTRSLLSTKGETDELRQLQLLKELIESRMDAVKT